MSVPCFSERKSDVGQSGYTLEVTAATNRGLVRRTNQDAILVEQWVGLGDADSHVITRSPFVDVLLAVADGVGGQSAGDIASRLVAERLSMMKSSLAVGDIDAATSAIMCVDEDLRAKASSHPSLFNMASTLAMALVSPDALTISNVGDSRIYFSMGNSDLRQMSKDDSLASSRTTSLSDGEIAARSSHLITQALGGGVLRRTRLEPHTLHLRSPAPWTLLLCSDGLTDEVDEGLFVADVVTRGYVADDLIAMALDAGGRDNVSVIVARCIAR